MRDKLYQKLRLFISERSGISEESILPNACLEKDLGIYGDDAVELLLAYAKQFNVDVSKFMFTEYFREEGDPVLPMLLNLITFKRGAPRKNLTVADLVKGITSGRLDENVINSDPI